jgi:hypothetical protein
VGALVIQSRLRRLRRHGAAMLAVLAIGGAIAVHHSDFAMGGMDHHGVGAALELCLGVFAMVGAGVAAVAIGLVSLGRWRPVRALAPAGLARRSSGPAGAAGPAVPLAALRSSTLTAGDRRCGGTHP